MSFFDLKITLAPGALALLRGLPAVPARAAEKMAKALDRQNELTIGHAQETKMSGAGPATLGVRTGLLRRALRRTDATVSAGQINSAIGENVAYAAVHEFGFDGEVTVRAHKRLVRTRDVREKKKLIASGIGFVKEFTRHMHMPERSFIRSSISERLEDYGDALSAAVVDTLEGETP